MSIRDKTTVDAEAKRPRVSRPTGSTAVHDREGIATDPRDLVRFSIPNSSTGPSAARRPCGGRTPAGLRTRCPPGSSRRRT
jgi:hypothetical protein